MLTGKAPRERPCLGSLDRKLKKNNPQQKWHFHRVLSSVTIWLKNYDDFCITYMDMDDLVSSLKIVTIATTLKKVLDLE